MVVGKLGSAKVIFSKGKIEGILKKSDSKCCHCGVDLSDDNMDIYDIIPYNSNSNSTVTVIALCKDCQEKLYGKFKGISYFSHLKDEYKEDIIKELNKYIDMSNWYIKNNVFLHDSIELEECTLVGLSLDYVEEVTEYIEEYNKFIKLPLYGEEGLVYKIFNDGIFYCLRGDDGSINTLIPIKPIKTPSGTIINIGNIMVNPSVSKEDFNSKYYYSILKGFLEKVCSCGEEPIISSIVVACNSKDDRVVPLVKQINQEGFKIARIKPGYSLAQTAYVGVNDSFKCKYSEVTGEKYHKGSLKSKKTNVKDLVKGSKKNFDKLVKVYASSQGGLSYKEYLKFSEEK